MNAITLFAGAGGADLGMRAAGVHHLACVEGNANACATLRAAGFPAVQSWIGDAGPLVPSWRWPGGPVDLLWASPPCQPYSNMGLMLGAEDERDGWPATLAAVLEIRPKWVIVENVSGAPVEEWAAQLSAVYAHVSFATVDAANWGLPSHRTRRIVVAGPRPYAWPSPTHTDPRKPKPGLKPWIGFGDALGLLPTQEEIWDMAGTMLEDMPDLHDWEEETEWMAARESLASKLWDARHEQIKEAGLRPDYAVLPCAAVTATEVKGSTCPDRERGRSNPINRASDHYFLATGNRRLSPQQCAVLLGFPEDYPFQGIIEARYRQVGNAVAPVMAEALARQVQVSE